MKGYWQLIGCGYIYLLVYLKALDNSFSNNFSLSQLKTIKDLKRLPKKLPIVKKSEKMQTNLVKYSYSAQKLQFQTILFPYKLCVTVKRTYMKN